MNTVASHYIHHSRLPLFAIRCACALRQLAGVAIALVVFTSCGELFELNEVEEVKAKLAVGQAEADLMVGDQYTLPATLTPDTLKNKALFYESLDEKIVSVSGNVLTAVAAGETKVVVTSVSQLVKDTCVVRVHPVWQVSPYDYRYDMLVFAKVTVDGRPLDNLATVGAFDADGTLLGVGSMQKSGDTDYVLLRIYSPDDEMEALTLRCYDRKRACIVECEKVLTYNGGTLGTLSALYEIVFN